MFNFRSKYVRSCLILVVLGLLLFSLVVVPLSNFVQPVKAAPWDSGWLYRKPITINHDLVIGDLANFPVLIDITDSDLASKAQPDGDDIMFTGADDSQLSHEIESYTSGHLVAWVKVPNLSSSVDTTIYMYYGNAGATNQENSAEVWDSNFMMVQHLDEISGAVIDSTVNNNDGSPVGNVVQDITGKVDGADDFAGSTGYISASHSDSITGFSEAFTASFWINMDSVSGRQTILNKWNTNDQRAWMIDYDSARGANALGLFVSADGSAYSYWYAAFAPTVGNWYSVSVVWSSGQQPIFYVNGAAVPATTAGARTGIYNNDLVPLYIARSYLASSRYFDGVIDEVRLSNSVRSPGWASTCYNNQVNPLNFYTVGSEETAGGPVNSAPVISDIFPLDGATNVPVSLGELSAMVSDPDGDVMDIYCTTDPDIGSSEGLGLPDTSFTVVVSDLSPATTYEWTMSVTDGTIWTNQTYTFTTASGSTSGEHKELTIDHTLVTDNLADFPVLIDLTDSDLASKAQPDGSDIFFTDIADFQLNYEIESYDAGHLVAWVKVPSLSSSVDTTIKMHYGDPGAGDPENPAGVWDSNFMMVQHLSETSGLHYDSTVNANDGSPMNAVNQDGTGRIDGADEFDGTDDYLSVPHSDSVTGFSEAFTASFWINMDSVTGRQTILNKYATSGSQRAWYIDYDSARGANTLGLFVSANGASYSYWYAAFSPLAGNWYHITVVWQSGMNAIFYVNGEPVTAVNYQGLVASIYNNPQAPLYFGRSYTSGRYFDGVIDEVHLSDTARSAQWIETCYNNQIDPSAFVSVSGTPEPTPPTVVNTVPVSDATGVPRTTTIQITFSEPMDRTSTEAAFSIDSVSGSFGWSSGDTVLTFTPDAALAYETLYTVTVTTGAMDQQDENMVAPFVFSFTTEAEAVPTPPTVLSHVPVSGATGVPITTTVQVTFSEPMDPASAEAAFSLDSVSGSFSWSSGDTVMTFTPDSALAYETEYTVTITVGAKDKQDENMAEPHTYIFTTEAEPGPTSWYSMDWQYRKQITVLSSQVSGPLTDFPVLIDITDANLRDKALSTGFDILFTDISGTNKLAHEIESYESSNGHLVAWVKVPSLSSSVDTVLWMYYGNPESDNQQNTIAVWDSHFNMVQHLSETSGLHVDSTVNGNNGSPVNGVVQDAEGKIDGADMFDGSNDYVSVPHSSTLAGFSEALTVEAWVRFDSVGTRQAILNKWDTTDNQRAWFLEYHNTNGLGFFVSQTGSSYPYYYASFAPVVGTWYHIVVVWQSGQPAIFYVNGVQIPTTTSTGTVTSIYTNAGAPLDIGRSTYAGRYFDGVIDEVRISNPARSAEWVQTCFNNQMSPSAFISVGTEETSGPTPPAVVDTVPVSDATGVPITTTVQVIFSEPMDHTSTEAAFALDSVSGTFTWSSGDTLMTFTPDSALDYETLYTVTVTTGAKDQQDENMMAPYVFSFTTETEPGPTPPTIISHNPASDESGVPVTASIEVTFSEPMNHAATEAAFSVSPSVSGSFSWDSGDTVLTFTPDSDLELLTVYSITVTTAAQDMEGEFMQALYSWSFTTTESVTAPYVTSTSPENNEIDVSVALSRIQIYFSEDMDPASVENSFSINPSVTGTFEYSSSRQRLRFYPDEPLAYDTVYTVTLSTDAMDLQDEHMLEPYIFSFTTTHYDPPHVLSTTPTSSETGVTYTIWGINFSEPMSSRVTFEAISITASPTYAATTYSDYRSINGSYMEFYFSPLRSYTTYTVVLSTDALSAQGENLTAPYSWTFTTGDVGSPSRKWTATIPSGQGAGEASPLIADITSDPGEEIVYAGLGIVRCLNGRTGATIWTYSDSAIGWNVQAQMGDIDNDGQMEIVIPLQSPTGVLCLNTDNTQTGSAARSLYWKRTGIGGSSYTSKPLLVDPDGDGFWMVFAAPEDVRGYSTTNTYTSRIWAFNYNGQEINNGLWGSAGGTRSATNGYNAPLGSEVYQWFAWRPCSGGFSMADTDNDGRFELFQNDRHMYYADGGFGKGTICWEWNPDTERLELKWYQPDMLVSSHAPILVDVTNDGVLEVVAAHMRGGLAIFNSTTGAEIRKDYDIGLPVHYQQVVYDIDHDGNPELLCADGDHPTTADARQLIVVFDLVEWKVDATMYVGTCKFAPTVGEVTGDGIMDMIAVCDTGVFIFDGSHDPSVDHTYPVTVVDFDQPGGQRLPYQCMYAVVQDIDADGLNEIVVTSSGYRVVAYDTPGVTLGPRPRSEVQYYNERRTGVAEYVPPVFYDRTAPIVSDAYPSHEATNVPVGLSQLQFTIEDLQGDLMDYTVTANFPVDASDLLRSNVNDGTYYVDVTGTLEYHTKYTWKVSVTDGVNWNTKSYTFTTPEGTPPGSAPTHNTPLLESDGIGEYEDATTANLTCTSQGTFDANGDAVTNIYSWLRNGQPIANLIMPFDTNSLTTAKDYSGYGNDAQIHGAMWTDNGVVGGAYSFDGIDDYMKISDGGAGYYNGRIYDSDLGGEGDWHQLTVELWFNMAEISSKESTRLLMKVPSYEIGLGSVGGRDRDADTLTAGVWLDNPDSGDNAGPPNSDPKANEYWRLTSSALETNTWYHVVLTYKDGGGTGNSVLALYINGSLVEYDTSLTTRGPIKASSGEPLYIGWYDYFKGMIDEVRIYSRALSAEQVLQRYIETKDGLTSSSKLNHKETLTGDVWSCQVIPNDSHWDGTARTSNTLTILPGPQVPPTASNVRVIDEETLSTSSVLSDNNVVVIYDYFDENDDPEVFGGAFGTQIRWYQNGTYMPEWDNLLYLPPSITDAHWDYTCTVTPGDGYGVGTEVPSSTTVVMNSPPEITDYSPEYQLSLNHLTLGIGDSQTFSFTCRDIDLDPVTVQWQVNGEDVTEAWVSYTEYTSDSFSYTFTELGSYTVRVYLTDEGYGYQTTRQSWSIVVR